MTEEWRKVPGWNDYEVSSLGRVRSLDRVLVQKRGRTTFLRKVRGRLLTPSLMSSGNYLFVRLRESGRCESVGVHRLVAMAFYGPAPSQQYQVAHWNGDGFDNTKENLRWATPLENNHDKFRHGTVLRGEKAPWTKIPDEMARKIFELRSSGMSAQRIAKMFPVSVMQAWRIGAGKRRPDIAAGYSALALGLWRSEQ